MESQGYEFCWGGKQPRLEVGTNVVFEFLRLRPRALGTVVAVEGSMAKFNKTGVLISFLFMYFFF